MNPASYAEKPAEGSEVSASLSDVQIACVVGCTAATVACAAACFFCFGCESGFGGFARACWRVSVCVRLRCRRLLACRLEKTRSRRQNNVCVLCACAHRHARALAPPTHPPAPHTQQTNKQTNKPDPHSTGCAPACIVAETVCTASCALLNG